MRKSESLYLLDSLGLNTIDYFITKDKNTAKAYLTHYLGDNRSMRTERGEEFLCPFFYNRPALELFDLVDEHIDKGYTLLFSPSLDWKDCVAFGATALTGQGEDHIDVVFGPGLNRELDKHPKKMSLAVNPASVCPFTINYPVPLTGDQIRILNSNYHKVRLFCKDKAPCILEWSLYPYPCGKSRKHFIFWELRSYL